MKRRMVQNYGISNIKTFNERIFMRNATLTVGDKKVTRFQKCANRRLDLKTLGRARPQQSETLINEIYMKLTLTELRALDNDEEKQEAYICSKAHYLERGLLNVGLGTIDLRGSAGKISPPWRQRLAVFVREGHGPHMHLRAEVLEQFHNLEVVLFPDNQHSPDQPTAAHTVQEPFAPVLVPPPVRGCPLPVQPLHQSPVLCVRRPLRHLVDHEYAFH